MKKIPSNKSTAVSSADTAIRILKIENCPSLSGKSTLTYHIGCNAKSEIQFRVFGNTGSGFFSNEWISLGAIQKVSNTIPLDKPITSFLLLNPIYVGRSQNSPGFLLAVLKNEGLVVPVEGNVRCYRRIAPEKFMAEVNALIESGVDLKVDDKSTPSKSTKPAAQVKNSDDKAEVPIKKSASKASSKKA